MHALGHIDHLADGISIPDAQNPLCSHAADENATLVGIDIVQMQQVLRLRSVGAAGTVDTLRVISCSDRAVFTQGQVQRPEKSLFLQVERQDAVVRGRSQVQVVVQLKNFVAVLEVAAAK